MGHRRLFNTRPKRAKSKKSGTISKLRKESSQNKFKEQLVKRTKRIFLKHALPIHHDRPIRTIRPSLRARESIIYQGIVSNYRVKGTKKTNNKEEEGLNLESSGSATGSIVLAILDTEVPRCVVERRRRIGLPLNTPEEVKMRHKIGWQLLRAFEK